MKYFSRFLILFLFFIGTDFAQEMDQRKTILWQGELTAVYKNKGRIKVEIPSHSPLAAKSKDEIKKELATIAEFDLMQKGTDRVIGKFFPSTIRIDIVKTRKHNRYLVELYGVFKMDDPGNRKILSVDFYIASFAQEKFYEEPLNYSGRVSPPSPTIIHAVDKKEMVYVPAGFFIHGQGTDAGKDNFNPDFYEPSPGTLLDTASYYIDKYEVTNKEYYRFLKNTNTAPPPHWENGKYPEGEDDFPVNYLTYREVEKYASWVGKRIPTEFEWEKAARGSGIVITVARDETTTYNPEPLQYPYGTGFESELCNTKESGLGRAVSVYELAEKGKSPYGAIGMCGNVAEWTSSWYMPYKGTYKKNLVFGKQFKVIRGGSFADSLKEASVYYRLYGGIPGLSEDRRAGFRLVVDVKK